MRSGLYYARFDINDTNNLSLRKRQVNSVDNMTATKITKSVLRRAEHYLGRNEWRTSCRGQDKDGRYSVKSAGSPSRMLSMRKICVCLMVIAFGMARSEQAHAATAKASAPSGDTHVTAVTGESWLTHLNRSFGDTSMGKTGRLGPGPVAGEDSPRPVSKGFTTERETVALHGSDLYRLNCQACHGESGLGAPPEINSVINPVRATSVTLILQRMKATGMEMSYADAAKLAEQSKAALMERLHKGGENMPAFPHLSDAEIRPLLAYLKQMADVPGGSGDQTTVKESAARVGELIVKSTCHTCHSAVGPDPGPQELLEGAIPPLNTLTTRKNQSVFIRKVTEGAPVKMGTPSLLCRGRMPVFYYLTNEEAADVYLYLTLYPPSDRPTRTPVVVASVDDQPPSGSGPGNPVTASVSMRAAPQDQAPVSHAVFGTIALTLLSGFVIVLLMGGVAFTFREFKRLSADRDRRISQDLNLAMEPDIAVRGPMMHRALAPLLFSDAKRSSE